MLFKNIKTRYRNLDADVFNSSEIQLICDKLRPFVANKERLKQHKEEIEKKIHELNTESTIDIAIMIV